MTAKAGRPDSDPAPQQLPPRPTAPPSYPTGATDIARGAPAGAAATAHYPSRLGQWVTVEDAWPPDGAWPACADLYQLWEATEGARDWRVPVVQVEDAIRAACVRWRVLEVAADPYRWQRSLEALDGDGLPVHQFFQTAARMGPATARAY